jgi:hypothetical protein
LPVFFLFFFLRSDFFPKKYPLQISAPSSPAGTLQISHARRTGEPSLLNNWAIWSGSIIGDLDEIKGVALWLTGSPFFNLR